MKKTIKIVVVILVVLVAAGGGLAFYVKNFLPDVGAAPDLKLEYTPEMIEKGRYLAGSVMGCLDCHAERDFSRFAGPVIAETKGAGGEVWDENVNFPGKLYAPNITPANLGEWTDGEIFRAITAGVDKDGKALFPIMPYHQYGKLPKEDIYAVIAYIRTLEPVKKDYPARELGFPLNFIVNLMPARPTHHLENNSADPVKRGEYLITAAACYDCHTPMEKGRFIEEMAFAGGTEFRFRTGEIVRSSNLTPDKETGIGNWTKEMFVSRFKAFADSSFTAHSVKKGEFNTYMPWEYYSKLKTEDLESMYSWFMTLEPKENKVVKFTDGN
ncbi:MAG: hypothetical protein JXA03_06325 [Bacteroidales bacterium]|nr:hypothetical protein [Bacteroidales bacterium]